MASLDIPPSARMPRAFSTAALLSRPTRVIRPTPAVPFLSMTDTPGDDLLEMTDLVATRKRTPYAVERYPAARGWVRLIGYDQRGDFAVDVTMPATRFTDRTCAKMRLWLMDEAKAERATLSLLG